MSKATQERSKAFAEQVLHVARLLGAGEWSDFGAVSITLRGNANWSQAVGNVIRKFGGEPHSRLLRKGGVPSSRYLPNPTSVAGTSQAADSNLQRQRLEKDGLAFINGHADPSKYVSAENLRERLHKRPFPASGA